MGGGPALKKTVPNLTEIKVLNFEIFGEYEILIFKDTHLGKIILWV